jgi:Fe-S oxidoreductase
VIALAPPLVRCTECGRCCTYVGVGINPPTSARHATDVLWYLYHEGVYAKVEKGFVPRVPRPVRAATARTARAARRRAVARKARI